MNPKEMKMARFFVDREGQGVLNEIKSMDFRDAGILDSLDMVTLAVFIEREFGKKLNLADPGVICKMSKFESLMSLVD